MQRTNWRPSAHRKASYTSQLSSQLTSSKGLLTVLSLIASVFVFTFTLNLSKRIITWTIPLVEYYRASPHGLLLLWLATVVTAVPPVKGFASCVFVAGCVFGGWTGYVKRDFLHYFGVLRADVCEVGS